MCEKPVKKFHKFCPKCGSTKIRITDIPGLVAMRELYYRCEDCGNQFKTPLEGTEEFIEDYKKSKVKKK
jgi:transposase-like protein